MGRSSNKPVVFETKLPVLLGKRPDSRDSQPRVWGHLSLRLTTDPGLGQGRAQLRTDHRATTSDRGHSQCVCTGVFCYTLKMGPCVWKGLNCQDFSETQILENLPVGWRIRALAVVFRPKESESQSPSKASPSWTCGNHHCRGRWRRKAISSLAWSQPPGSKASRPLVDGPWGPGTGAAASQGLTETGLPLLLVSSPLTPLLSGSLQVSVVPASTLPFFSALLRSCIHCQGHLPPAAPCERLTSPKDITHPLAGPQAANLAPLFPRRSPRQLLLVPPPP